jgi:cobalt/nickel transport system ATP-binding protein
MEEVFRTENISYRYNKTHVALENVSFSIQKGEIFSVIGSNGSGKSTLLHLLAGLFSAEEGKVMYKNDLISEDSLKAEEFNRYFRESVGYIFQNSDSQLFCPTVFDELVFAPLQAGNNKETAFGRAEEVMKMMNIDCLRSRPTYMLSGGEKKRVAIGSILTMNPEVILFDEPMSGLDPKNRSFLIELIFQLNEAGKTIVIATHHLELADHLQSRVAVLSEQHKMERIGQAEEVLSDIEFLIRMNLIHEQLHRHGSKQHKHIPPNFLFHKHS